MAEQEGREKSKKGRTKMVPEAPEENRLIEDKETPGNRPDIEKTRANAGE